MNDRKMLELIYKNLYKEFGRQHWWPAESPFEVIIGAILTQNTNWGNVEKALNNIKAKRLLTPKRLYLIKPSTLAKLIQPSGYYNIKTRRIKNFLIFLFKRYNGNLKKMFKVDLIKLREELLQVNGIGKETADSILLYAADKPIFVVDAYTKRIFYRHNLIDKTYNYDMIQSYVMKNIPNEIGLFNEYHALIVKLGKSICKTKPKCNICPLNKIGRK